MKLIFLESTLQIIYENNPTVAQQIINKTIKKQTETGVTYFISQ